MINIICEVANGYYGNVAFCKKYIDIAAKAKSNAVKFQIAYAKDMLNEKDKIYNIIKNNEMSLKNWQKIRRHAKKKKINFYLDIDGIEAFDIAKKLKPDAVKIHTTSFFDKRLLLKSISTFKKIYISISGIYENEVDALYKKLKSKKMLKKVVFLFGHQNVPTKIENTNLSRLIFFMKKYKNISFGYMDHVSGSSSYKYSLSVFALGLGINCFEKHLTISRKKKLIDSISALEAGEFKYYVRMLHDHKKSLGKYTKKLTSSEKTYRNKALTVIHSKTEIKKGQKISYDNITHKRSLNFSSQDIYNPKKVLGKISKKDIGLNETIKLYQLK